MNEAHVLKIAGELKIESWKIEASAGLLDEDATIPFIARYRKEATGSLDEVVLTQIRDRLSQLHDLDSRKDTILKSLEKHGHLTDELKTDVLEAKTLAKLEDIYLPYRPKRRTRATIAKEKGLEPLAETLFAQTGTDPQAAAADFIDAEKGVESEEDALSGARDIIAEWINENAEAREKLRERFSSKGIIQSHVATGKEDAGAKYRDYFEWEELVATAPSHRVLAMRRGEKEDFLNLTIAPAEDQAIESLENLFVKGDGADSEQVKEAAHDGYRRLLFPSMETEIRIASKERADIDAIKIFSENLRHLLLAPPLGPKRIMGVDPGFRSGCKLVCLDAQGKLLHHDTIYPHQSESRRAQASETVKTLCAQSDVESIGVGNGTAGRETEAFLKSIPFASKIPVILVNESGASVYSASDAARAEFPELDLTVRGTISIGRRLMDPLAELVKIDPKSIGVGQYQHDVDQSALKDSLDDVVVLCVNAVGVDLNRASVQLLTYVSGLGPQLAKNIVAYRDETGPFQSRVQLKKVTRLGPKAFEQCAGFLRIADGKNPLDASAVHPESYAIVKAMARDTDCSVTDLMNDATMREKIDITRYVTDTVGVPTLVDIMSELAKPGRDPREALETVSFTEGVEKISDLLPGMKLPGVVTNVTAFGAFVDVGVHQDGLVHISELADRFVKTPADVVKVNQQVTVTVMAVDMDRDRISLSMKKIPGERHLPRQKPEAKPKKPVKTQKPVRRGPEPFNNPFADAFKKRN
jgi:protein Tex